MCVCESVYACVCVCAWERREGECMQPYVYVCARLVACACVCVCESVYARVCVCMPEREERDPSACRQLWKGERSGAGAASQAIRTHEPLYSSSIRPSQQDSLLYTQFSRTHPSSISSSIHSIHCGTHLLLYLNISMCDLVLKDLLRRI
jgi:hypothetical protein